MLKKVVRLGDISDHGGKMITANSHYKADGIQTCVDGDLHDCPLLDHGITKVHATTIITKSNGKYILRIGDMAECGAIIIRGSGVTKSS